MTTPDPTPATKPPAQVTVSWAGDHRFDGALRKGGPSIRMDASGCPYLGVPLFISPHSPVRHFCQKKICELFLLKKSSNDGKNGNESKSSSAVPKKNQWSVRVVYFSLASLRSALK